MSSGMHVSLAVLDKLILQNLGQHAYGAPVDLIPHLFFSSSQLAKTVEHATVAVRIATQITRHYKQYKPVALPLVVEGLKTLGTRFPSITDIPVLLAELEPIANRGLEHYILLSSNDERIQLRDSNYVLYCPVVRDAIAASLSHQSNNDLLSAVEDSPSKSTSEEFLAVALYSIKSGNHVVPSINEELCKVVVLPRGEISETIFSLIFRISLLSPSAISSDLLARIVVRFMNEAANQCDTRTIIRCMQSITERGVEISETEKKLIINSVCSRVEKVSSEDIVPFLQLVPRLGVSLSHSEQSDKLEARIAVELSLVKSLARREEIVSIGKKAGLAEPNDVIDEYEDAFIETIRGSPKR
jgi:hypothetical protein